jgi:class 3 adenylate cyclase
VNIAARLEGIAYPGGICVSGRVQEDVRGKLDLLMTSVSSSPRISSDRFGCTGSGWKTKRLDHGRY